MNSQPTALWTQKQQQYRPSVHVSWSYMILLMFVCFECVQCQFKDFTYNGQYGPDHWQEQYNTCGGKYQSPINIDVMKVHDKSFYPLLFNNFDEIPVSGEVLNNGHTVVVKLQYTNDTTPTISGGPLYGKGKYRYSQLHFHWGENNTVGSEDTINNYQFAAELHIVFYNEQYKTFEDAVKRHNGVAVLAFFYSVLDSPNDEYKEFTNLLDQIHYPDLSAKFNKPPPIYNLICDHSYLGNYFTYTGSLTTPPCSEDVTWIDFIYPVHISDDQIEHFRHLHTHGKKMLSHNFRPVQPLNNRTIYKAAIHNYEDPMLAIPFVDRIKINKAAHPYKFTETVYVGITVTLTLLLL